MGDEGSEQPQLSPENTPIPKPSGTESGTRKAKTPSLPPDLADVVNVWPKLPPAIRAGILAMIQATKDGTA